MSYANEIEPFVNVGAGDIISIDFDDRECSVEEYADILGFPVEMTKNLLDNKVLITPAIAKRVEDVTGIAQHILFDVEKDYLARKEREERATKSQPIRKSASIQVVKEM